MNNPDTELIFPIRLTPLIAESIHHEWAGLTELINTKEADPIDQLGFVLTMAKLAGCISCNSDSFRAMRGCTQCAVQTMKRQRVKGPDLKVLFEQSKNEIENYSKMRYSEEDRKEILVSNKMTFGREFKNE